MHPTIAGIHIYPMVMCHGKRSETTEHLTTFVIHLFKVRNERCHHFDGLAAAAAACLSF
jgi:hypothetical protein